MSVYYQHVRRYLAKLTSGIVQVSAFGLGLDDRERNPISVVSILSNCAKSMMASEKIREHSLEFL